MGDGVVPSAWEVVKDLQLSSEEGIVYSLHILAPSSLVVGTESGDIHVFSLDSWDCLHTIHAHEESVLALASVGGSKLVSGSADGTIIIWSTTNWEQDMTLHDHEGEVNVVEVFMDKIFSAAEDASIRVWANDGSG